MGGILLNVIIIIGIFRIGRHPLPKHVCGWNDVIITREEIDGADDNSKYTFCGGEGVSFFGKVYENNNSGCEFLPGYTK